MLNFRKRPVAAIIAAATVLAAAWLTGNSGSAGVEGQEKMTTHGEATRSAALQALPPLCDLPADYGAYPSKALADGVFVDFQHQESGNQAVVDSFHDNVSRGKPAFMRVVTYTREGDPIIADYEYDGRRFTVTIDESRDRFGDFGNKNFVSKTYMHLVPDTRSGPQNGQLSYYLSNDSDIRAAGGV